MNALDTGVTDESRPRPAGYHTDENASLSGWNYFFLWAGVGIALSEIWAGGLLAPLGLLSGLTVILLGHLIGNTPLALAGLIGSRHGVPAMVSTRPALGHRGSTLPAALNVLQLVGWTAVMLWIGGEAAAKLTGGWGSRYLWIGAAGLLTTLWALGGQAIWHKLQAAAVLLLALLSALMTYLAIRHYGWSDLLERPPAGGLSFMGGLDLVIAMPISWLPLVADYARHARRPSTAFSGTWLGYFLAGSWMYGVGLVVALATGSGTPDAMLMDLMADYGLAVAALIIVLISTFTTTFLDIYSNAISIRSITTRWSERTLIGATGLLGTGLAMVLDPHLYEHFLLLIGSAFCPLFGVVLSDYFLVRRGQWPEEQDLQRGPAWRIRGLAAWLAGVALYHALARLAPQIGASLPALIGSALLYLLIAPRMSPSNPENQP